MFNPAPNAWIASWSEDGTSVEFPIASIPELTAAEADGTTGDIRKVLFALLSELYAQWVATDEADRPTKMTLFKSSSINTTTSVVTTVFTAQFITAMTGEEVAAE